MQVPSVAIYARHSDPKQATSTADQIVRCRKFCAAKGYLLAGVYSDEGISGAHVVNRPGIAEMMSAALEREFDRVVCEDLSRFSRDQGDVANFYKRMTFLGVTIESVTEGVITELHIGLKGTMNALYLKDLGDKTRRGMIAAVLKGRIPGGAIYGYDVVHRMDEHGEPIRGLRAINDSQADVVRRIFKEYAQGETLGRICKDLNALGIPSPSGGRWGQSTLVGSAARKTGLLRNTIYKGVVVFNRMTYRKHPDTGKRLSVMNPENEWIDVPVPELAIVDTALFDQVQRNLDERSSVRRETIATNKVLSAEEKLEQATEKQRDWRAQQAKPAKPRRITSGKLRCAIHGETIRAASGKLYGCAVKPCANRYVNLDDIWPMILNAGRAAVTEAALAEHFDGPVVAAELSIIEGDLAAARARLEDRREEVSNVLAAIGDGRRTEQVIEWLASKESAIRRTLVDIERLEEQRKVLTKPLSLEVLARKHRELIGHLMADMDDQEANRTLRAAYSSFNLSATRDEASGEWRRSCRVEIDFVELVRALTM